MPEVVPLLEEIVEEQGMLDDPTDPDAAVVAVVLAPCVELLEASPGNCTAACGLTEAEALIPGAAVAAADPTVADPTVSELAAGVAVNDVDAFDEVVMFDEATPDEPPLQLSAIERLPMNEPPEAEQGVPGRLAAFIVVALNAAVAEEEAVPDGVLVADVLAPGVVPPCEPVCEAV